MEHKFRPPHKLFTSHGVVFRERVDHDGRALGIVESQSAGFFRLKTDAVVKLVANVPDAFAAAQRTQLTGLIPNFECHVCKHTIVDIA